MENHIKDIIDKKEVSNRKITKIILLCLVVFMFLPTTITIMEISIFKIEAIALCIFMIYIIKTKCKDMSEFYSNFFVLANIIFSILIIISIIANFELELNLIYEVLRYVFMAMITFIVIKLCQDEETRKYLLKAISIVAFICAIYGIIQYFNPFSINELFVKSFAPVHYRTLVNNYRYPRIISIKPGPAIYGIIAILGIFANTFYYKYAKRKKLILISIGVIFISLMMTLSRTTQIAFIASVLVFVTILSIQKKGWKRSVTTLSMVILLIIVIFFILPDSLTWRLMQVFDFENATSWQGRIQKWQDYYQIIMMDPIVGIGPIKNLNYGNVDSEIIQILMQYGITGFTFYILMLLSPLYYYKRNHENKHILLYYLPLLTIILITNIAATTLLSYDMSIGIYLIIGIILSMNKTKQ